MKKKTIYSDILNNMVPAVDLLWCSIFWPDWVQCNLHNFWEGEVWNEGVALIRRPYYWSGLGSGVWISHEIFFLDSENVYCLHSNAILPSPITQILGIAILLCYYFIAIYWFDACVWWEMSLVWIWWMYIWRKHCSTFSSVIVKIYLQLKFELVLQKQLLNYCNEQIK